ncbi:MAG: hypothetical protein HQK67_00685 [Desulfamplus sp.]|nr:hypothetical protein [Desulfamplus sp.]
MNDDKHINESNQTDTTQELKIIENDHPINTKPNLSKDPTRTLPKQATIMHLIDTLLKEPYILYNHVKRNDLHTHLSKLILIFTVCVFAYGIIVGSFSGQIQWISAPLKIFFGTCLTVLLCFPSLYILSSLSGTDLRPTQMFALLCGSLAIIGILLIGFAPIAFVFTFSINALPFMGTIHLLVWGVSLYFGLHWLTNGIAELGSGNTQMIRIWAVILLVTLLQMSTTLRPILGQSDILLTAEKKFFLAYWFDLLS